MKRFVMFVFASFLTISFLSFDAPQAEARGGSLAQSRAKRNKNKAKANARKARSNARKAKANARKARSNARKAPRRSAPRRARR